MLKSHLGSGPSCYLHVHDSSPQVIGSGSKNARVNGHEYRAVFGENIHSLPVVQVSPFWLSGEVSA